MSIDLTKIAKGPLTLGRIPSEEEPDTVIIGSGHMSWCRIVGNPQVDAEQQGRMFVLAAHAFDVMMRRGWGVEGDHLGRWYVWDKAVKIGPSTGNCFGADPFTAIVEADKWHTATFGD